MAAIRFEPYDREYLDLSYDWLHDPEIKEQALAPDFTREEQEAFFASLPGREDYKIWGIAALTGEKIGAAGIKHISGSDGELWCYIGDRSWWGKRLSGEIFDLACVEARALGVERFIMTATTSNTRSLHSFMRCGFEYDDVDRGEGLVQLSVAVPSA